MEPSPSPLASLRWEKPLTLAPGKATAVTPAPWMATYDPRRQPRPKKPKMNHAADPKELEKLRAEHLRESQAEGARTQATLSAIAEQLANEKKMREVVHMQLAEATTNQEPIPLPSPLPPTTNPTPPADPPPDPALKARQQP
jgi:hypothetical protein